MLNVKNKSHAVTAEVEVPRGRHAGVIVAQGGPRRLGALRPEGRLAFCYNLLGVERLHARPRPAARRGAPGAGGVRLRRRGPGQGRRRHPLRGRPGPARGASSARTGHLLPGRDD